MDGKGARRAGPLRTVRYVRGRSTRQTAHAAASVHLLWRTHDDHRDRQCCHRRQQVQSREQSRQNFTQAKIERRRKQLEESVARYLSQLDTADLQEPSEVIELKKARLKEKLEILKAQMGELVAMERRLRTAPDKQVSLTDPDARSY
jgi:hypothetical protein